MTSRLWHTSAGQTLIERAPGCYVLVDSGGAVVALFERRAPREPGRANRTSYAVEGSRLVAYTAFFEPEGDGDTRYADVKVSGLVPIAAEASSQPIENIETAIARFEEARDKDPSRSASLPLERRPAPLLGQAPLSSPYEADVRVIRDSWREMRSNVDYMLGELAGVAMPAAVRAQLQESLDEFDGLLRDLHHEIFSLEDKLGLHPGEEPFDPDIVDPDPRVTMGFLRDWPRRGFRLLDTAVRALGAGAAHDPVVGLAYSLVAESAANMLNANARMRQALDRIDALLTTAS